MDTITTRTTTATIAGKFAVLLGGGLLLMNAAHAQIFGVRVVDEQGSPIAGAAVCVGMEGNYSQFGATFTDERGEARVDVPNVPLVVTVSKTRFSAMRIMEPARRFSLIKEVMLPEGQPGPRCKAESSLAAAGESNEIRVRHIDVAEGAYSTVLNPDVSGDPSHYRLSATPEFSDARWQRFGSSIAVPGELQGNPVIYLQMRRYAGSSAGWLEVRSEVITIRLSGEPTL